MEVQELSLQRKDQYGKLRPISNIARDTHPPVLIDENGCRYYPSPSKTFTPFRNLDEFVQKIKIKNYKEAKLETKLHDMPNDIMEWLKKLHLLPMQRRVWMRWLRSPEVKELLTEGDIPDIAGIMYEYFIEAATGEALSFLALHYQGVLFTPEFASIIAERNSAVKLNRTMDGLYYEEMWDFGIEKILKLTKLDKNLVKNAYMLSGWFDDLNPENQLVETVTDDLKEKVLVEVANSILDIARQADEMPSIMRQPQVAMALGEVYKKMNRKGLKNYRVIN